jgi:hypothetical protein
MVSGIVILRVVVCAAAVVLAGLGLSSWHECSGFRVSAASSSSASTAHEVEAVPVDHYTSRVAHLRQLVDAAGAGHSRGPVSVSPETWGAQGNYVDLQNLSMDAQSNIVRSTTQVFSPRDIGRVVFVAGAGLSGFHQWLIATAQSVPNDRTLVLSASAERAVRDASGGMGSDDTDALQKCWDATGRERTRCEMAGKSYLFNSASLIVRDRSVINGISPKATVLVCGPSVQECVGLDSGPVQFTTLSNFQLSGVEGNLPAPGSDSLAQRGFHFVAHGPSTPPGGGLWQSQLIRVEVTGMWGTELSLEGGQQDYMHPNQFLTFADLELQAPFGDHTEAPPIDSFRFQAKGQNAQIEFIGGQIHGTLNGQFGSGILLQGTNVVSFSGTTCEWLDKCLVLTGNATETSFTDGWIENVKQVIDVKGPGRGFYLERNHIANSCYDLRDHSGFCVRLSSPLETYGTFNRNFLHWSGVIGPDTTLSGSSSPQVNASNNLVGNIWTDYTLGQTRAQVAPAADSAPMLRRGASSLNPVSARGNLSSLVVTWQPSAFLDSQYTATCSIVSPDATILIDRISLKTPSQVTVHLLPAEDGSLRRGHVECLAIHD